MELHIFGLIITIQKKTTYSDKIGNYVDLSGDRSFEPNLEVYKQQLVRMLEPLPVFGSERLCGLKGKLQIPRGDIIKVPPLDPLTKTKKIRR
jgi:hypothetical protein